jgi:hypothetical protein
MMAKILSKTTPLICGALAALAGCGGGNGGDMTASASQSAARALVVAAAPLPAWEGVSWGGPKFAEPPLAAAASTRLVVGEVVQSASQTVVRGTHTLAPATVANYRVAFFTHYDVFYLQSDALANINADGTFQVTVPRSVGAADRIFLALYPASYDPMSAANCVRASGYCRGVITGSSKMSLPQDPASLTAFTAYYFAAAAASTVPEIAALQRMMNTNTITGGPYGSGRFIRSYRDMDSAFLYDQALAVIAFAKAGDQPNADLILNALAKVQSASGGFEFSYLVDGSVAQAGTDLRIAGSIAWLGMALNTYQKKFASTKYLAMSSRLHNYLLGEIIQLKVAGSTRYGLRFAPTDYVPGRTQIFALEHQLDGYAAMHQYYALNGGSAFNQAATRLRAMSEAMWNGSRFLAGFNSASASFNVDERYLDNYSWSNLALGNTGSTGQNFAASLSQMCDFFITNGSLQYPSGQYTGVIGFYDGIMGGVPPASKFAWSEGSMGAIMAINGGAPTLKCSGNSATNMLSSFERVRDPLMGLPYTSLNTNPDFSGSSGVAGTAWFYYAKTNQNPYVHF